MNGYTAAVLAPLHSLLWPAPQSAAETVSLPTDISWFDQSELVDEMPSPSETESDEEVRLKPGARDEEFELEEDDVSIASSLLLCQQTVDFVYTELIFGIL